ncbi:MAG: polysaccharide biosynthesis tyrosine autokinase [Ginsengibacter sp.]
MEDQELFSRNSGGLSIKEQVTKYLSYYPLFIISVLICVGAALLYLRYAVPKYRVSTLLFVKKDANASSGSDLVETAITGEPVKPNLDNEIQLIGSNSLLQQVVSKNGFNITYSHIGKVRNDDIYMDAPFRLIPQEIKDSGNAFSAKVQNLNDEGGTLLIDNNDMAAEGQSKIKITKMPFKWNVPFRSGLKTLSLIKHGDVPAKDASYKVMWSPVAWTAGEIGGKIDVSLLDKKTTIIVIGILIENVNRGKDILNALAEEYKQSDIDARNVVSQNTIRFIDDRLSSVTADLSGVEGRMEDYQGSKGLINVDVQSSQSFENNNNINREIADISVKQNVAQSIMGYFNNPAPQSQLVPSTLGIDDPTLANLISNYNELQLRKQKEAPSLAEGGIILKDLNNQLNVVKGSILESLQNINKNLKQKENSLQQQNGQYRQFLSALPSNQRAMQEIKRKQSITQGLYLYLLQKREEAAVSSTSANVSNYKQIDPAMGMGLVSPNGTNIKIYSFLIGLILPFGIIYLKDTLNDKIMTRKDITSRGDLRILGEVSHLSKRQIETLAVKDRDLMGEEFRIIRTNLYFMVEKKSKQVILVTSSVGGEGKSLVSTNLAAVLAISGKKVALIEFDLRRPSITSKLKIQSDKGLNDYFNGQAKNLSEIYHSYEEIPSLHIYHAGSTPKYAGDLFLSEKMPKLFADLKSQYDYVIVDSAPVGMVSDGLILGEYADAVLFLVRQRFTPKKQLEFINELSTSNKLNEVGIIFNDVKRGAKVGYYGYGNTSGKYYSYGETTKKSFWSKRKEKAVSV